MSSMDLDMFNDDEGFNFHKFDRANKERKRKE
jgi:hypothetical protein